VAIKTFGAQKYTGGLEKAYLWVIACERLHLAFVRSGERLFCWRRRERFSPKPSRSIANHSKHYDYEHNNTPHDALILKHFPELPFAEFLSPVAQW
jgi:hypothetical protein